MDERQRTAASAIAGGKTIEEAANESSRSPRTVLKWMEDPEIQAAVIRGIRALALLTLAQNLKHGEDQKGAMVALATLRWLGAGKPRSARKAEAPAEDDDDDLGEFSAESLRRLKGEE